MNTAWFEDKRWRALVFFTTRFGWVEQACTSCAGSGHYDHNGAPPCGACEGTGRERVRGPKALTREQAEERIDKEVRRA